MKVVVTFDINEKNLDDLVVMAKVYRKKDGYKEFVSVENNLPLRLLPEKKKHEEEIDYDYGYIDGWNECLETVVGDDHDA